MNSDKPRPIRFKSYPRVSQILLSCTSPGVRPYISLYIGIVCPSIYGLGWLLLYLQTCLSCLPMIIPTFLPCENKTLWFWQKALWKMLNCRYTWDLCWLNVFHKRNVAFAFQYVPIALRFNPNYSYMGMMIRATLKKRINISLNLQFQLHLSKRD